MSIYSGFGLREQESRYNITLFDMVLTLSARVYGTLKNRTSEQLRENQAEFKFLSHINKLHRRLQHMESHKHVKPFFSQAADRLNERIVKLIGRELHDLTISRDESEQTKRVRRSVERVSITDADQTLDSARQSNNRPVTLEATARRSPHHAYYAPPKATKN